MILTNSELKTIQKIEVEMLNEVIIVCDKLNLKYFVIGGTLLGAVRHKGFIPWDDDIDIAMLRKDYEIFIKDGQKYLPPHLFIQNAWTDKNCMHGITKIRNSNTTFIEEYAEDLDCNKGVFIDIFPLDYIPDNLIIRNLFLIIHKFLIILLRATFNIKPKNIIKRFFYNIFHFLFTIFNIKSHMIFIFVNNFLMFTKKSNTLSNLFGYYNYKEICNSSYFSDFTYLEFEKINVRAPLYYHEYLTEIYDDYMTLPPVEERKPHHYVYFYDFNKSYLEYINKEK